MPEKLKGQQYEIKSFCYFLFIKKENEIENKVKNNINNENNITSKDESAKKHNNSIHKIREKSEILQKHKNSLHDKINKNKKQNSIHEKNNKIAENIKKHENSKHDRNYILIEEEIKKIKENLNNKKYDNKYYSLLDDIEKRCFIYNPKNMFIKRIFSHIYYDLIFYDKAFTYIKYIYLLKFRESNVYTKQLNYPSKTKNFLNIYEPKLFLKKDFNFFDEECFLVSHDYLVKGDPLQEKEYIEKKKEAKKHLETIISSVYFYRHNFNINNILKEKRKYFDCELVTPKYLFFGYIIFGKEYIYFETKNEYPKDYTNPEEEIDLDLFLRYSFSIRNRDNKTDKYKRIIIFNQDIKKIVKRRQLLMYQAIEIFCHNGKSFFFNFF